MRVEKGLGGTWHEIWGGLRWEEKHSLPLESMVRRGAGDSAVCGQLLIVSPGLILPTGDRLR